MPKSVIESAFELLNDAKKRTGDKCLIAYSGGKDSLVITELCHQVFSHCEAFFMYLVPGLECAEAALDYGRARWNLKIHQFPHWTVYRALRGGAYCNSANYRDMQDHKLDDIYALAMHETGIPNIATGAKKSDSLWRRRQLGTWGDKAHMIYPIKEWNKFHVKSFLDVRGIPLPDNSNRNATGIDLTTPSLLWLHDEHPKDFARVRQVFPHIDAVVARRHWFGVT